MEIKNIDQLFFYFRKQKEIIIKEINKNPSEICKNWINYVSGETKCHIKYKCNICNYIEHLISNGNIEIKNGLYKGTKFTLISDYIKNIQLKYENLKGRKKIRGDPLSISVLVTWSSYFDKKIIVLPIQTFYICTDSSMTVDQYKYTQMVLFPILEKAPLEGGKELFKRLLRNLVLMEWNVINFHYLKKIDLLFYNGDFSLNTFFGSQIKMNEIVFLPTDDTFISSIFLPIDEKIFQLSLDQIKYCMYSRNRYNPPLFSSIIEIYYLLYLCMKNFPNIVFSYIEKIYEEKFEDWIIKQQIDINILDKI